MKPYFVSLFSKLRQNFAVWLPMLLAFSVLCAVMIFYKPHAAQTAANPAGQSDSSDYYRPNASSSQENSRQDAANSANIKNSETFYTVRAYEGSVAIFEGDEETPLYRITTPLSELTEGDRSLLRAGIRTETLRDAYKCIEDYE